MFTLMHNRDVSHIEKMVREKDGDGHLVLQPASWWRRFPWEDLRIWMHQQAVYQIPTLELVKWLTKEIDPDQPNTATIEIGAGGGSLGWHLYVPQTDSFVQLKVPWVAQQYAAMGQPPTRPQGTVREFDAIAAIEYYKPKVVVGAWITEYSAEPKPYTSAVGVPESELLRRVKKYIHIGSRHVHGHKTILEKPHREVVIDGLMSRAQNPADNIIYIWE